MSATSDMVNVMLAHENGKRIEVQRKGDSDWEHCPDPSWDWEHCNYRVMDTVPWTFKAEYLHRVYRHKDTPNVYRRAMSIGPACMQIADFGNVTWQELYDNWEWARYRGNDIVDWQPCSDHVT